MEFKSEAFVDDLICSQFSLATLTEVEFSDCYLAVVGNREISGLVIGEKLTRHWLYREWDDFYTELAKLNILDSNEQSAVKKAIQRRDDLYSRESIEISGRSKSAVNYFLRRVRDFNTCDGIILTILKKEVIPLPFELRNEIDYGVRDRSGNQIDGCKWGIELEKRKKLFGEKTGLRLLVGFGLDNRKPTGNSFLLPLALARLMKRSPELCLHPLEIAASGLIRLQSSKCEEPNDILLKARAAKKYGAKIFLGANKNKKGMPSGILKINVNGSKFEDSEEEIKKGIVKIWKDRLSVINFNASKASSIQFKLIFDFDVGPDFEWRNKEFSDLRKVSRKSEYLSELKMPNVSKVFNKNFYFEKQNGPNTPHPLFFKLNLDCLKSHQLLDEKGFSASLTGVDLIPFCDEIGAKHAKIGFEFTSMKSVEVNFLDYYQFISSRRFGATLLKKKGQDGQLSFSQLIEELRYAIYEERAFDIIQAKSLKTRSLNDNQPFVVQVFQMSDREKLGIQDKYALRLLSALSDKNRFQPKEEPTTLVNDNSPNTLYSIHKRAFSVCCWSNTQDSDTQHNQEQKPSKVLQSYYFLWLLSKLSKGQSAEKALSIDGSMHSLRTEIFKSFGSQAPTLSDG